MEMNDEAQLHTLEGLAAALLITTTLFMVINYSIIASPQSDMKIGIQLKQSASDALTVLDVPSAELMETNLTEYIAGYDTGSTVNLSSPGIPELDDRLAGLLPGTLYNLDLAYVDNSGNITVSNVIVGGMPARDAIVTRKYVVLDNATVSVAGGTWNLDDDELKVVEVRLIAWKL